MLSSFIAYILIPAYTIWFVQDSNWFTSNFSVIGNMIGREEEFVLWGLLVGLYCFCTLGKIVALMPKKPKATWMIPTSLILLTIAITTPYLPEYLPLKSFLHVIFAFMAAVCLLLSLYFVIWSLYHQEKSYRPYVLCLVGITLCSALLLFLAGIVSSALEIFFAVSVVILIQRLYKQLLSSSPSSGEDL